MLVELSINPLGRGAHISRDLAPILKLIDDSGLRYVLTPFGTCIEGEWNEVMPLVKRCHDQAQVVVARDDFGPDRRRRRRNR